MAVIVAAAAAAAAAVAGGGIFFTVGSNSSSGGRQFIRGGDRKHNAKHTVSTATCRSGKAFFGLARHGRG